MKVLWLTPDKPDDISVGRQRIATHLESRGLSVTLRGTDPETTWRSLRELGTYDVLVGTSRAGAIAGTVLQKLDGLPFVVDHIDPIRQFGENNPAPATVAVRELENLAFRRADHVLYVYEEEADRVEQHADATTETALGVQYDRFADPSGAVLDAARERLADEPLRSNVAIYIGGLEPIYHVEEMLASVEHLDDWTLLVVGTGSLADEVDAAAASTDAVVSLGTVPHEMVPGLLHEADVGLSLVDDPYTLKVLEYGAAGLPVVQLQGRAEAQFSDRVTYCTREPASIAGAIEEARDTSAAALQKVAARFDWAEIAATYADVLERVVADESERRTRLDPTANV